MVYVSNITYCKDMDFEDFLKSKTPKFVGRRTDSGAVEDGQINLGEWEITERVVILREKSLFPIIQILAYASSTHVS